MTTETLGVRDVIGAIRDLQRTTEKRLSGFDAFNTRMLEIEAQFGRFVTRTEALNMALHGHDVATLDQRGALGAGAAGGMERKALAQFARTGELPAEVKNLSVGTGSEGGYTVSPVLSDRINQRLFDLSPLARLARRVDLTDGDGFEEPIDPSDIAAEWAGEKQARPVLAGASFMKLTVPLHEVFTNQRITQRLLDDSRFDLGMWLEAKIADKFARTEAAAFITGDSVGKPRGLLNYPTSTAADGARDWFTVQHILSGADGFFDDVVDTLVDTVHALRAPYRARARWLMNSRAAGEIRKIRSGDGSPIWGDSLAENTPPRLLGYPVELDEQMPDMATGSLSIAFGDFSQAYLMIQRPGLKLQQDPFTDRPNVLFYAYRRIGGALANGEAVKLIKFSAT